MHGDCSSKLMVSIKGIVMTFSLYNFAPQRTPLQLLSFKSLCDQVFVQQKQRAHPNYIFTFNLAKMSYSIFYLFSRNPSVRILKIPKKTKLSTNFEP